MKPRVAVFTKENPCTKIELWNCFRGRRGWMRKQVDEAHAIIGVNAPRNMIDKGYVEVIQSARSDYYQLTDAGKEWLDKKTRSYLALHPGRLSELSYPPK